MKSRGHQDDPQTPKPRKRPGRVPVSCAECRRLKLRCDRNHPCDQCKKRGCSAICPEGTLAPGKGSRLVLTNTEQLHDQVESLQTRVRQLEDALRTLQATVSIHPHPLLSTTSPPSLGPIPPRPVSNIQPIQPPIASSSRMMMQTDDDRSYESMSFDRDFADTWHQFIEQLGF
ncbi:hypothetical protein BD410DRAFT_789344 [Rickenella mellea]|uniref:Zn(2)-C6 fungal-type domain-containing protein n=1 Tax=Rickenella mellea TaxID=50990 RepID=A0A4Y7Q2N9_9AGAM|nr:hypothetical protein BD410DRAFT_789344 [Rickenella mellea]